MDNDFRERWMPLLLAAAVMLFSILWVMIRIRRRLPPSEAVEPTPFRWLPGVSKAVCFLGIGLIANGLVILVTLPLLRVPEGMAIKPMGLPVLYILSAGFAIGSCMTIAKEADRPEGSAIVQWIGAILAFTPFFVGAAAMNLIAALRNLQFG